MMPHFRQIDYNSISPDEALLMRAKLHIRGGKRRLREGKISLGIVTLYDALNSAIQWYVASSEHKRLLRIKDSDNVNDDHTVSDLLVRAGIIDPRFNYNTFDELVDMALKKDMSSYDYSNVLKEIETVMTSLGVMPFDENELPPDRGE